MNHRTLGRTGLSVTELGFGAYEIGFTHIDESEEVGRLLNRALDLGINFVDSSAAYFWSEELISKYIGHRRGEFIFASKCGSWRVLQPNAERTLKAPREMMRLFHDKNGWVSRTVEVADRC